MIFIIIILAKAIIIQPIPIKHNIAIPKRNCPIIVVLALLTIKLRNKLGVNTNIATNKPCKKFLATVIIAKANNEIKITMYVVILIFRSFSKSQSSTRTIAPIPVIIEPRAIINKESAIVQTIGSNCRPEVVSLKFAPFNIAFVKFAL